MPAVITPQFLGAMFQGFNVLFNDAFKGVEPQWNKVAMEVPSTGSAENYAWLGQMPRIREWIGEREVKTLEALGYTISNRSFESTIGIPRDQIEDDKFGVFNPAFSELGRSVALFPDELVFPLLTGGATAPCYDGQNFFDPNHPVRDANGNVTMVSNVQPGAGPMWFLLDTSRHVKPLVYQKRRPFEFVAKTDMSTSDRVFQTKEFLFGTDGRANAGYGLWQLAFGSGLPLNRANFRAAYEGMVALKGDYGRPLGIKPTVLVVGPSLHATARDLLKSRFLPVDGSAGQVLNPSGTGMIDNTDRDLVEIFYSPWLQ